MSVPPTFVTRFQLYRFHTDLDGTLLDKSKLFGCSPAEVDDSLPRIGIVLTGKGIAIIHSDNT